MVGVGEGQCRGVLLLREVSDGWMAWGVMEQGAFRAAFMSPCICEEDVVMNDGLYELIWRRGSAFFFC